VAFSFIIRDFFSFFYITKNEVINLTPIIALFCLPLFFHYGNHYYYDFPSLFLFTAGLLLMLKKKWVLFYITFIAGLINKETISFLTLGYILINIFNLKDKTFLKHLLLQLLLITLSKFIIQSVFTNNAGTFGVFSLYINLDNLLRPYSLYFLLSTVVIFYLIFADFKNKPKTLKKLSLISIPFLVLYLIYGRLIEVRALYEIFPLFFILIMHSIFFYLLKIKYEIRND
jgi:hypothetical protein